MFICCHEQWPILADSGGETIPLIEMNGLFMLDVDLGGSSEARVSATSIIRHVRLGHRNAADQEQLSKKGVGVAYADRVPEACGACLAKKSTRQPRNKETGTNRGNQSS